MIDDRLPPNLVLPAWCAILRRFDRELLHMLVAPDEHELTALLDGTLVSSSAAGYELLGDQRARILDQLRAESPLAELTLHTRAFELFLRRLAASADSREADEERCLYHLSELRELLIERMDWRTIIGYLATLQAAGPLGEATRRWLVFYQGYADVRVHDYDHGDPVLLALERLPDLEPALRIRVLHALGHTNWFQSRYDRALALYHQAYTLACDNGDVFHQGYTLLNMSQVHNDLDQYEQALDLSLQSLALFRALGNPYRVAHALFEVGNNAVYLGRWQMAQQHFHEATALYDTLDVAPRRRMLYWNQGFLAHLLGDETESEAAYLRALEFSDPRISMDSLVYLGLLYQSQQRWSEALAAYEQAITWATHQRNWHTLSLIHYRRGNVFQRQGQLDDALQAYRDAIDLIENLRGATEDEMIKIGLLGTTQQVYEAIVLLCLDCQRPVEAFEYVERARSRAFLDALTRKSPELYDAVAQFVATMPEIQAQLPANALLVEYFTTGVIPRGEHLLNKLPATNTRLREQLLLPPQVLIFAIAPEQVEVHRAALDPNTLRPMPNDPGPGRRLLYGRMPSLLYERLIAPIGELLAGRDLLYLIPHGPLHYVPFQALRAADTSYLIDHLMLARAPSATILLRNCLSRHPSRARRVVALGYNDPGGAALLHAEAEARSVAQVLDGEAWIGGAAKSRLLLEQGRELRWLHVACHAVFKPDDPLDSELRLGFNDALTARRIIGELDLGVDLVVLSACTSGLSQVVSGDELLGLQRAFLHAGAPTVVCTLWEAADLVTRLVMERFYLDLRDQHPASAALRAAQIFVRQLTGRQAAVIVERWRDESPPDAKMLDDVLLLLSEQPDVQPFADPVYWAPFMLIGRPG